MWNKLGGEDQGFEHAEFRYKINSQVEMSNRYLSLMFWREVWATDIYFSREYMSNEVVSVGITAQEKN